jgi:hypothetical protein
MSAYRFWQDLTSCEQFMKNYYKVWKEFIDNNSLAELEDYIDCYFSFAENSFLNNANRWGYSDGFTESDVDRAKSWLKERCNYIYNNLPKYNLDDFIYTLPGDISCNNQLTVHDVALLTAYLNGDIHKLFNEAKADCDGDGKINDNDVYAVASYVMESEAPSSVYWYSTPVAAGELYADAFKLELGEEVVVPLSIAYGADERYNALQFDLNVPEGLFINDITVGNDNAGVELSFAELGVNTYRVVAYTIDNTLFEESTPVVANISLQTFSVIEENFRKLDVKNIYAANDDNDEVRMNDISLSFAETTGLDKTLATYAVKGGECITVTSLEQQEMAIYSVDGRLVHKVRVGEGTTRIAVPSGMYIVNDAKVFVY